MNEKIGKLDEEKINEWLKKLKIREGVTESLFMRSTIPASTLEKIASMPPERLKELVGPIKVDLRKLESNNAFSDVFLKSFERLAPQHQAVPEGANKTRREPMRAMHIVPMRASDWIDVNEVLPPVGVWVITHGSNGYVVAFCEEDGSWQAQFSGRDDGEGGAGEPTHWAPLPAEPKTGI